MHFLTYNNKSITWYLHTERQFSFASVSLSQHGNCISWQVAVATRYKRAWTTEGQTENKNLAQRSWYQLNNRNEESGTAKIVIVRHQSTGKW